ncbi:hypothetical protein C8F01DRAFT_1024100 [Mycena amicta]|nr:hypothetical protein C8F01DRAFT_1024100 [Mycena amicta]
MSTLELIWDSEPTRGRYKLWSWTTGTNTHYVARVIRKLRVVGGDGTRTHASQLFSARIGAHDTPMVIPESNRDERCAGAVVKMAYTPDELVNLEQEASMYEALRKVQGLAVPKVYGHFRGRVNGKEIACLVMQYCQPPYLGDPDYKGRYIMDAAYSIHAHGVAHGDLLNGRHIVPHNRWMMFVDLSKATSHRCVHGQKVLGRDGVLRMGSCSELVALEQLYGRYM